MSHVEQQQLPLVVLSIQMFIYLNIQQVLLLVKHSILRFHTTKQSMDLIPLVFGIIAAAPFFLAVKHRPTSSKMSLVFVRKI
jgi:hypothetical protein